MIIAVVAMRAILTSARKKEYFFTGDVERALATECNRRKGRGRR
jgi:hypothetical protein